MKSRQRALKHHFMLLMGAAMALALLLVWLVAGATIRILTEDYIVERIQHEIDTLHAELSLHNHDLTKLAQGATSVLFHHAFSGHYFSIQQVDKNGKIVQSLHARSLEGQMLRPPDQDRTRSARFTTIGPRGTNLLGVTRALTVRDQQLVISVAEEVELYTGYVAHFQQLFAWICLGVLALLLLTLHGFLKRGFCPFKRLEKQLVQLSEGAIRRLDVSSAPREVIPLVKQINWMLETAEQRVLRTRTALDNMAHSLKRPLTILMQTAEDPALEPLTEQRHLLIQHTQLMQEMVERSLRRARLVDISLPGQQFSLQHEMPILVHTMRSLYYQKQLEIDLDLQVETICLCDREEMLELLGNLLDNACKWAKRRILLTVEQDDEEVRCIVEDDGPGASASQIHTLTERGKRLDEAVEGHGLGLAIAQEIIQQLRGRLELGRSERLGGFMARCCFARQRGPDQMGAGDAQP